MAALAFIPSPSSNGFSIGPLFFHAYGIAYVFAVAAAILISRWGWRRMGGDPNLPYEVAVWAFPAGLIGGRIYFDITTPSQMPDHWWGPFAIWTGGLGIWGGVAAGVLVGVWRIRRRLAPPAVRLFADVAGPGILVAQGIGRIGNYFNQELFGAPSNLPWALEISRAHRVAQLAPRYWRYPTFEPTFLYEMIWDFGLAAVLIWLAQRRRFRAPGIFALYVAGYSGFRIFEETQRIDYSNHFLGLRLNFFVSVGLCLLALLWFLAIQRGWLGLGGPAGLSPTEAAYVAEGEAGAGAGAGAGAMPRRPPGEGRDSRPPAVAGATAGASASPGAPRPKRPPPPPRKRSRGRR